MQVHTTDVTYVHFHSKILRNTRVFDPLKLRKKYVLEIVSELVASKMAFSS
jgi:hypothetical protein